MVKVPAENTNNGQYGPQICCHLNRDERRHLFDLATAIHEARNDLGSIIYNSTGGDCGDFDEEVCANWVEELDTATRVCGPSRKRVDLFTDACTSAACSTLDGIAGTLSLAPCFFATPWATFSLNKKPDIPAISIDSLAERYSLADLRPALLDLFSEWFEDPSVHCIGGRQRTHANTWLPFTEVMVWFSIRMQTWSIDNRSVTEPRRLNAAPLLDEWPLRRYDTVLLVKDSSNPAVSLDVGLDGKYF